MIFKIQEKLEFNKEILDIIKNYTYKTKKDKEKDDSLSLYAIV